MPSTNTVISRRSLLKTAAGIGAGAVLAGPALGLLSPAAARSTDSLIVNTAGARLRSGPGTGYATLASLGKGTEVRYLADGGSANGYRWSKVRVLATGKEGFVAANLLSAPDGSGAPVIIGIMYTSASVNLRSGPSSSNQVLRVVPSYRRAGQRHRVQWVPLRDPQRPRRLDRRELPRVARRAERGNLHHHGQPQPAGPAEHVRRGAGADAKRIGGHRPRRHRTRLAAGLLQGHRGVGLDELPQLMPPWHNETGPGESPGPVAEDWE